VYNGLWYSPLRRALDAFVNETQTCVTGNVKVKLYKGHTSVAARTSVFSLYSPKLATYTHEDTFDHRASEGFIKIFALPVKQCEEVRRQALSQESHTATPKRATELVS
jgi:argininosuccinate synthase